MPATTILLVGNVYENTDDFTNCLKKHFADVSVHTKQTVGEALAFASSNSIQAMVCTQTLPEEDGMRFVQRMRNRIPNLFPIILLLDEDNEQQFDEAYSIGTDRCIAKESVIDKPDRLARDIKHLILTSRARDTSRASMIRSEPKDKSDRYRLLIEAFDDPAILVDSHGIVHICNRSAEEQFGEPGKDLFSADVFDLFPVETVPQRKKAFQAVLKSGKPVKHTERLEKKSCEYNVKPIFDENGQLEYVALFLRDITDQIKLEHSFKESRDDLLNIIDSTNSGILVTDLEHNWTHFNRAFLEMWDLDSKVRDRQDHTAIFKTMLEKVEDPEGYTKRLSEIVERLDVTSSDIVRFKNGNIYLLQSYPRRQKNTIFGRVWVYRDVTEQERINEKLRRSEELQGSILDALSDGILFYDDKCNVIFANKVAAGDIGIAGQEDHEAKTEDQITQHANVRTEDGEALTPDKSPAHLALQGIETRNMIVRYIDAYGKERLGDVSAVPIRDENGQVYRALVYSHDVTAIKNTEAELRTTRDQLDAILRVVPGSLMVFDTQMRLLYCNQDTLNRFGVDSLSEIQGTTARWYFEQLEFFDESGNRIKEEDLPHIKVLNGEPSAQLVSLEKYKKTGRCSWISIIDVPVYGPDGNIELIVASVFDITKQKEAELELIQAQENLEEIVEERTAKLREHQEYLKRAQRIAKIGHFIWDVVNDRTEASEQLNRILGEKAEKIWTVEGYLSAVHPDDREYVQADIETAMNGADRYRTEHRVVTGEGKTLYVYAEGEIERDKNGNIQRIVGTMQDITKLKDAELNLRLLYEQLEKRTAELQISQQQLKRAQEIASMGHWVWMIGEDTAKLSDEGFRILGFEPQPDWGFAEYLERVHPDDRERVAKNISDRLSERPVAFNDEHRIIRADGEVRYLYTQSELEFDEHGKPFRSVGVLHDITERKLAEMELTRLYEEIKDRSAELQESREYLERALRIARMGYFIWDVVDDVTIVSDQLARTIGLEPGSFLKIEEYLERTHPDDREGMKNVLSSSLQGGDRIVYEYRMRRSDGEYRFFYTEGEIERNEAGDVTHVIGMTQDITRIKEAEQELHESQSYLKRAQQISHLGHFVHYIKENRGEVSEQFNRIMGFDDLSREWNLQEFLSYVHDDDRGQLSEMIEESIATGEPKSLEFRICRPDGQCIYIDGEEEVECDEDGRPFRIVGTIQDITKRKMSELELRQLNEDLEERTEELRESQAYLKRAQSIAKLGHFIWYADEDRTEVSEELVRMTGVSRRKRLKLRDYLKVIHPEDRREANRRINEALEGKQRYTNEHRILTPGGEIKFVYTEGEIELNDDGTLKHIVGTMQDITDRKQHEIELKQLYEELRKQSAELVESQKYLKWGERIAKLGYFVWDFKTDSASVSEEFNNMMGAEQGKVWSWEEFADLVHPDDRDEADRKIKESVAIGEPYRSEYRVSTLDGREMYLVDVGEVLLDENGEPYLLVGVQQDITERKLAEIELTRLNEELAQRTEELRESRMYLERAQRIASVGHFVYYVAERNGLVSEQFNRLMGSPDLKKQWSHIEYIDAVHPEDREETREILETAFTNATSYTSDHRVVHPDGTVLHIHAEAEMELNDDGTAYRAIGTIQDVTKRRLAEIELRLLNEELEKRSEELKESRLYLERAQRIAHVGHFVFYLNENESYVSDQFNRMMGIDLSRRVWTFEEYLAQIHPDDFERISAHLAESFKRGKPFSIEHKVCRPDGSEIYVAGDAEIELDDDGRPYRAIGILQDVTKRKEAELELRQLFEELELRTSELRESRKYLEMAQELAHVGHFVYLVDENRSIVSDEIRRIMGEESPERAWSVDEYLENVHLEDRERVAGEIGSVVSGGGSYRSEHRLCRPDGTIVHVYSEAEVEQHEDGRPFRILGMIQDITTRKEAELELRELHSELEKRVELRTKELKKANEELKTFTYAVSHDLRAPLRHLRGFSDMLNDLIKDTADDQSKLCLTRITESTETMDEIITSLLWLSRSSQLEPERISVDLSALARNIFQSLGESDPERNVRVEIAENLVAMCDEKLMTVALQNLIDNAWKFTGGTSDARIEFGIRKIKKEEVYYVKDNGVGFDPKYSDNLFQPFKRLHDATDFQGIGVGLATVKRVIERHGGRIWAESEPGKGATFFFTLKQE